MKTDIVHQTKDHLRSNINRLVNFWITWNWIWLLSGETKLQLTKRTTKTGRFEKILKTNNIESFYVLCCKLIATRNIIQSILKYMLMRPLRILWQQEFFFKKNQKLNFSDNFLIWIIVNSNVMRLLFLKVRLWKIKKFEQVCENHGISEEKQIMSTPLNSIVFRKSVNKLDYASMGKQCWFCSWIVNKISQ